ncbi:J domain-containing protein [Pyxidicoccus sp. MSG2]|uniref:J domain-containing protein n=1 Tax=Pyxidicoccus sp. MSG2 TaxID=2996790 RepID=UPI00226DF0E1|nr:J domain-containing protein [Pyxidicoccus sp. MSG2]MCY1019441.1 J domain-containing protein [Pyxidicoccus sp. MSG2]
MLSVPFFGTATELSRFTHRPGTSVVLVGTGGTESAFPQDLAERIFAWSSDVKLASASPEALARVSGDAIQPGDVFIFADGKLSWRSEPALNLDSHALASQAVSLFISALSQQGYVRLKQRERNDAIFTRVKLIAMERLLKNRAKRASRAKAGPEPVPVEDPYALLGLTPGASFEEARAARNALLLQYHPDKVAGLGPKLREVAEAETKRINAAFASLTAPVRAGRGQRE